MPSKNVIYDYTNLMSKAVGAKHGVTPNELSKYRKRAAKIVRDTIKTHEAGGLEFIALPSRRAAATLILRYAEIAREEFENFVLLGIGGSALGPAALHAALNPPYYNLLTQKQRGGCPRVFFEDNVDPVRIANLMEVINPKKTLFNVITKSGGTSETLAALLTAHDVLRRAVGKNNVKKHLVATTDAEKGNLRVIADRLGLASFPIPRGVGGRFSVLTAVGLLPAAMAGIDILALLSGAAAMRRRCLAESLDANPALASALHQYIAATKKGKTIQVMMPYSNQLYLIADWYRQLWAESLGKKTALDGRTVYAGQTPVKALGVTDQHSQVQLYVEGPNDKTITFLRVEKFTPDVEIPRGFGDMEGLAFLGGRRFSELINAEQRGTEIALTAAKRPNSTLIVPRIDAHAVGQLLFLFQMQTAFAGSLLNINAFDQPGVEAGKLATYALMGRPGYEKQTEKIEKKEKRIKRKRI
ncbi:MAG: glucose-6-phosphate isomerase [bacterium]